MGIYVFCYLKELVYLWNWMLFQHQVFLSCLLQIYHALNALQRHITKLSHLAYHIVVKFHLPCASSFSILMTTFPAILWSFSQTPIGRKSAFLSRCTSLLLVYVSSGEILFWNLTSLIQLLMKSRISLQASDVKLPNAFEVNNFGKQDSESRYV